MNMIISAIAALLFSPLLIPAQAGTAIAIPAVGTTIKDPVSGIQLTWIPKGCFLPANVSITSKTSTSPDASADVTPTCIERGFWMGKFEITQGQYQQIMGENPSSFKHGEEYPVENVRWLSARAFIRELNKRSGKAYRLPSEAEWEYAARSGGKPAKFGASGRAKDVAWYMANSGDHPHPVGEKKANGLGLYDMSGNVWEWTHDCWNEDMAEAPTDGSPWTWGKCSARVLRGGSWYDAKSMITTHARLYNYTDKSDNNSGFRIVLD